LALAEAEKRDHRKLGAQLDLFHMQEEAIGQVFWHHKGWTVFLKLQEYIREKLRPLHYEEVNTPQIVSKVMYDKSGHWDKFGTKNMFITEAYDNPCALKPMNCPCHIQIFNQGLKSYRDLPLRMAEFGSCNRYEPSGALHGIMRVRGFTQDDGHIFCTEDQIESECAKFIDFLSGVYEDLGFKKFEIMFATRPEKRVGSEESWDHVESALENAIKATGNAYTLDPGEGAFYGPKLDFKLTDAIGRVWQCGTFQVDPNLPERLGANYIAEDGNKHRPFILHRACLGSFERFLGILIENFAGRLPLWLAPRQVVVAAIVSDADKYCLEVVAALKSAGIRAEADLRNEKINYKVREHSVGKVPVILACGMREVEEKTVSLRRLGQKQTSVSPLMDVVDILSKEATPPDVM
jgi:threonyl-tRNA synthetase